MLLKIKHKRFWIAVVIHLIGCTAPLFGHDVSYLNKEWLVYDESSQKLFPFVNDNKKNLPLHVYLPLKANQGLGLSIKSSETVAVYINSKFVQECHKNVTCIIPIDSLIEISHREKALLSFYGIFNNRLLDSIAIVSLQETLKETVANNKHGAIMRIDDFDKNYFAIVLMVVGFFFAMVRTNYSKVFSQFYNLTDLLFGFRTDASQLKTSFEGYYFTFALVGAVFFALATTSFPVFVDRSANSFLSFFFELLYLVVLAIFFYLLKYVVTMSIAWLFSVGKYSMLHYKIFIKTSVVWSTTLVLLALVRYSEVLILQPLLLPAFMVVSLFFLTLTSIKVSILINHVTRVSTLYLISYLCVTEWLPYFVILKLYMVYFY